MVRSKSIPQGFQALQLPSSEQEADVMAEFNHLMEATRSAVRATTREEAVGYIADLCMSFDPDNDLALNQMIEDSEEYQQLARELVTKYGCF